LIIFLFFLFIEPEAGLIFGEYIFANLIKQQFGTVGIIRSEHGFLGYKHLPAQWTTLNTSLDPFSAIRAFLQAGEPKGRFNVASAEAAI
jgi:hypothetical protein